jgi:flagellar biosynthetic protein FliR
VTYTLLDAQTVMSNGLWHLALVFIRIAAVTSLLPAFGERTVPMRVKLGLAMAFSVIIAPAIPVTLRPDELIELTGMIATETGLGLALGISVRLFSLGLQTAGSIAAQSTSLAQLLGGAAAEPIPAMGYVLVVGGLALAMISGLHVHIARFLLLSYDAFPVGQFPEGRALSAWGVLRVSRAFELAFMLAAPFVIASMIYNLALGVINRAMPQLMVAFIGAPVITLGGLCLLLLSAPLMLSVWSDELMTFLLDPPGTRR